MSRKYSFFTVVLLVYILVNMNSCVPPSEKVMTTVDVNIGDPVVRKIWTAQDEGKIDSLKIYFSDKNPTYRYLAALSLASVQNPDLADSLKVLLNDINYDVRSAAAYSLGQIGNSNATIDLISSFISKDTFDVNNVANSQILEAVGKLGTKDELLAMATVKAYRNTDTLLLLGQTRGIYRFAMRGIIVPEGTDLMVNYVTTPELDSEIRLYAANYLARAKDIDLSGYKFRLIEMLNKDSNPDIRMAVATALGKIRDPEVLSSLINKLEQEKDYRVQCNILRSLSKFDYPSIEATIKRKIDDENLHVAVVASEILLNYGDKKDALTYPELIKEKQPWQVKTLVYAAIFKNIPFYYSNTKKKYVDEVKTIITNSSNRYEIASYVKALGYDPLNFDLILDDYTGTKSEIQNTASIEAIRSSLTSENFINIYGYGHRKAKMKALELFKQRLRIADVGECAEIATTLQIPELEFKMLIDSTNFIDSTLSKLRLPRDIEAYNALEQAKSYLLGRAFEPKKVVFNNPIDWNIFNNVSDTTKAVIKTTKGNITIKFFPQNAPGSVTNFIKLVNQEFFNKKNFHRVVPNFVIQGGCPRGDGYGALDYTIRSELGLKYYDSEGYVGMASAGKDTEGTQFFITNSPAPHLDGRYTIFAKVVEGMDVVNQIEVGDKIENVIIIYR
ncbi:MAG TPA: peptidylprolyl isomerase [Saprospiraceae bacterium]|nr:peptidylprolyl isomerase [Saprospiraceae bacterium]